MNFKAFAERLSARGITDSGNWRPRMVAGEFARKPYLVVSRRPELITTNIQVCDNDPQLDFSMCVHVRDRVEQQVAAPNLYLVPFIEKSLEVGITIYQFF